MTGDTFNMHGPGSVGKVDGDGTGIVHHHYAAPDLDAALRSVVEQAIALRDRLNATEAVIVDDAVAVIQEPAEKRTSKQVGAKLLMLLGIATAAGNAGQALIEPIETARAMLGG